MTFPESVRDLYNRGLLPTKFRVAHVCRHLSGAYSQNYIRTALANYAEGGNYVIHGAEAKFRRVSRGAYQLI
jgi:hypothetical protein